MVRSGRLGASACVGDIKLHEVEDAKQRIHDRVWMGKLVMLVVVVTAHGVGCGILTSTFSFLPLQ